MRHNLTDQRNFSLIRKYCRDEDAYFCDRTSPLSIIESVYVESITFTLYCVYDADLVTKICIFNYEFFYDAVVVFTAVGEL